MGLFQWRNGSGGRAAGLICKPRGTGFDSRYFPHIYDGMDNYFCLQPNNVPLSRMYVQIRAKGVAVSVDCEYSVAACNEATK